jgi:hypothetical protein
MQNKKSHIFLLVSPRHLDGMLLFYFLLQLVYLALLFTTNYVSVISFIVAGTMSDQFTIPDDASQSFRIAAAVHSRNFNPSMTKFLDCVYRVSNGFCVFTGSAVLAEALRTSSNAQHEVYRPRNVNVFVLVDGTVTYKTRGSAYRVWDTAPNVTSFRNKLKLVLSEADLAICPDNSSQTVLQISPIRYFLEKIAVLELYVCSVERGDDGRRVLVRENLPPVRLTLLKDRNTHQRWAVGNSIEAKRTKFRLNVVRGIDVNVNRGILILKTRTIIYPLDADTYHYVRSGRFFVYPSLIARGNTETRVSCFRARGFLYLGDYNPFHCVLQIDDGNQTVQGVNDPNLYFLAFDAIIH